VPYLIFNGLSECFAFHGCDESVRDRLLNHPDEIVFSKEKYDWLGHGMYFWENNYERALQWAEDKRKWGKVKLPAVIGATIFLGYCCDFLDSAYLRMLKNYFDLMNVSWSMLGRTPLQNRNAPYDKYRDKILRDLDCAVIEFMHEEIRLQSEADILNKGFSKNKIFDSVRGVFTEGGPVFEGAGILEKSHIQICIRNPNCIKGFFLPRKEVEFPQWLQATG
jgi:hypothetical protein